MSDQQQDLIIDGWAIVQFMGHVKRAGRVKTVALGGNAVFRVETPDDKAPSDFVREYYGAGTLYSLVEVTEEVARLAARSISAAPIEPWQLPTDVQEALRRVRREERDKERAIEAGTTESEQRMSTIEDGGGSDDDVPFEGEGHFVYRYDDDDDIDGMGE